MRKIDNVYQCLKKLCAKQAQETGIVLGVHAESVAQALNAQRTNISTMLNVLYREDRIDKIAGKPVLYRIRGEIPYQEYENHDGELDVFSEIIGASRSLKNVIQQARAAIIYPPKGLHTLLNGETGTGKSMFAQRMHEYAKTIGRLKSNAPFVVFNCADYANNSELLMAQLFGVKKGAYTGADKDRSGLIEQANEGILFLDEVHRLPPEGQEMLFYLIDKGAYRRLGETSVEHKAEVLLICATTENLDSVLLKTFTRRIPMLIRLPSLRERTLEERYELIKTCFRLEASCINESITLSANCIKALLLYDCANNIGQLQSDIKLCCAKAFLENRMKKGDAICVASEDLPQQVMRGLVRYKEHRDEIDKLIRSDSITFSIDETIKDDQDKVKVVNFYEALEEKRRTLESKGINENDISLIMSLDIDNYFKRYMRTIDTQDFEGLYKVVDRRIVTLVEVFLNYAQLTLQKHFDPNILYGLSMHVAKSMERISSGSKIENHKLAEIKKNHGTEFAVACTLAKKLEDELKIPIPEDEIGFLTMFLCLDKDGSEEEGRVGVVVAMHGQSAATSLVDVANRLLGENHGIGYNMPLEQKTDIALDNLVELVKGANTGKGVLLLVDMGSLAVLGDIIYEKTKISIKTVEMVSTSIVIEAVRKALLNGTLEEVYDACKNLSPFVGKMLRENFTISSEIKDNVIITACITGQGTAAKLQSIITEGLSGSHSDIDVLPIEVVSKREFNKNLEKIKAHKNVLAVVSVIEPEDSSIFFVPMSVFFQTDMLEWFSEQLMMIKSIHNMKKVIEENVQIDATVFVEEFRRFYLALLYEKTQLSNNTMVGLILHLAYVVERVLKGDTLFRVRDWQAIKNQQADKVAQIARKLLPIEEAFGIRIAEVESVHIAKMIYFL